MDSRCPQRESAVGWALYALEPADEHLVRDHLPYCAECRDTVCASEAVAALLGSAVSRHEPPPELRVRLLAALDQKPPIVLAERRRKPRLLIAAAAVVVALAGATTVLGVQAAQQSIAADPGARRITLSDASGRPLAQLVIGKSGAAVIPLGLAANRADQTYVLWGVVDGKPRPLAPFDVTGGSQTLALASSTDGIARFAISLERGRSMPSGPTDVVATG